MTDSRVQGLADSFSLLDGLSKAADLEAARDLYEIGKLVLAGQQAATPEDTGALKAGLSIQVLVGQLRDRVGLLGTLARSSGSLRKLQRDGRARTNLGDLFYGLFVRYGRKAQTVLVQRRRIATSPLRGGRKRAEDIAATYSMNVRPMDGRDFIDVLDTDPTLDAAVTARLASFWSRVGADAGATI